MTNHTRDIIKERLKGGEKKQLTFNVSSEIIEKMDKISDIFNDINKRKYPRNSLIEDAIETYITEIDSFLRDNYDVDIEKYQGNFEPLPYKKEIDLEFDTVVYPGYLDGFEQAFIGEKRWYYVRIRKENIPKIKYIAVYLGKPVSGITHYAEVEKYVESGRYPNKYLVYLKGDIITLKNKIELGNLSPASTRAPRYTSLVKLKKASTLEDL